MKHIKSNLTIEEKIKLEQAKVNSEVNMDKNPQSNQIVNKIREQNYSCSKEFSIIRKTIKLILDHLGIVDEKFEEYNNLIEQCIVEVENEANNNENTD